MAPPARANVSERLRRIESITDAALAHLDFEELLEELLDRICELLDVETSAVLLLDDSAQFLVPTATRGLEDEIRQGVRIPIGRGFAGRVAAQRQPVIIERVDRTTVVNPILIGKGLHSLLGVPLLAGRSLLGVLHVGSTSSERRFFDEDVKLLQLAADRVALATQVRLSEIERATTEALQRSLVPTRLPALPGLDLAARYVPGEGNGVGGDWYDLFVLPSGWPCLVIGDVVGHGLRAAVVMGRLRSALRAYALEGADPAAVLTKLDRKVLHFEPGAMATVLYAMFEPGLERLHVSSAGHLPPVLAPPGGEATLLNLPTDPPLGVRLGQSRRTATIAMPAGAVLCFYTDGLVERRGGNIDDGLRRLCAAVQARPAEDVCATVMATMVGSAPNEDDAAILMVRREVNVELAPLELVLAAVPTSVREARVAARHWLATAGATHEDRTDLLIVLGEAISNAVEHAYGPRGGEIHVRLEHAPPDVLITVRDYGTWREPRGKGRGNGTTLIRACSDEADIEHSPSGTVVTCRRRLTGQDAR